MPYNYVLLFIFVSSSSQNLNNDLWSKLQGYAANKVVRVIFKSFHFFQNEKKNNQLSETDTSVSCQDEGINIEKRKSYPKGSSFIPMGAAPRPTPRPAPRSSPFLGGAVPQTLVLTGVPTDQDMKCWTTIKS